MWHRRAQQQQRRPLVLLVEDDDSIRVVVTRVLESDGYEVLTAPHGRAALALLASHSHTIDLLITDLTMPELGGEALVAELATRRRVPPVLFMSGKCAASMSTLPGAVLQKPFTVALLKRAVHDLLGPTQASQPQSVSIQ
jgi:two-component system, cell cycle sensor histidine kinase and response regulator CckA